MIEMLFRDPQCFQSFQNPKWKYLALVKGMIFQCHSFRYGGLVLVLKKALWKQMKQFRRLEAPTPRQQAILALKIKRHRRPNIAY